jgi:hypothetical protein
VERVRDRYCDFGVFGFGRLCRIVQGGVGNGIDRAILGDCGSGAAGRRKGTGSIMRFSRVWIGRLCRTVHGEVADGIDRLIFEDVERDDAVCGAGNACRCVREMVNGRVRGEPVVLIF